MMLSKTTEDIIDTNIVITAYDDEAEVVDTNAWPSSLQKNKKYWINIVNLKNKKKITELLTQFNIHALVIEDVFNTTQRPKIDYFDDYFFMVVRIQTQTQSSVQFSFIVLKDVVISIQDMKHDFFDSVAQKLQASHSKVDANGAIYLFYMLLDSLVDNQIIVVDDIETKVDELEELFLNDQKTLSLSGIYKLKRQVMLLRKKILPLRDCILSLLKSDNIADKHVKVYFRDVYDHTARISETLDALREMLITLLEIYLSSVNNRMNQTMKVLTMFAAIFIPLSFIASLYGMNFQNMPELKWHYGYYFTLGVMALIGGGLLFWFKKKKWW